MTAIDNLLPTLQAILYHIIFHSSANIITKPFFYSSANFIAKHFVSLSLLQTISVTLIV